MSIRTDYAPRDTQFTGAALFIIWFVAITGSWAAVAGSCWLFKSAVLRVAS